MHAPSFKLRIRFMQFAAFLAALCASTAFAAVSNKISSEHLQFFENKIRPILATHCLECHSAEKGKIKGGLNLDSAQDWSKGGESGPLIKLGDVKGSTLIKAVTWEDDLQMPPKKKLSEDQINALKEWVRIGAPDPREPSKTAAKFDTKAHWAFQPVVKPAPPTPKNQHWCNTAIDKFVLSALEAKGMIPASPAGKETLLRRAFFDLIGLPPTPKKIESFMRDQRPNAFAEVIDDLLDDPAYGERWGRHWLDTARYSDTTGELEAQRLADYRYPYAWTYREWVIKALNSDMPYDQFILNQIAADKIPNNKKENLAALGFLTVGQRFKNKEDEINDRIDVIGRGFLGLTIACARCHNHKFDPITAEDYYALRGVFANCLEPKEGPLIAGDEKSPAYQTFLKQLDQYEDEAVAMHFTIQREYSSMIRKNISPMFEFWLMTRNGPSQETINNARDFLIAAKVPVKGFPGPVEQTNSFIGRKFRPNDRVMGPLVQLATATGSKKEVLQKLLIANNSYNYATPVIDYLKTLKFLPATDHEWAELVADFFADFEERAPSLYAKLLEAPRNLSESTEKSLYEVLTFPLPPVGGKNMTLEEAKLAVSRWFWGGLDGEFRARGGLSKINEFRMTFRGGPAHAMIVEDKSPNDIKDSPLFVRGNAPKPGEDIRIVPRKFIDFLSQGGKATPFPADAGSGRLELAKSIASKNNPLTARVLVNRVWMYHFGEGLVRSPDDLGNQAGKPSHPELLDFLAAWFMEDFPGKPAWSVKGLHKAIMLSKIYQQSVLSIFKEGKVDYDDIDPTNSLLWHANIRRMDFESFRDSMLSMAGLLDRSSVGGPSFNVTDEPFIFRRAVYAYIDRLDVPDLLSQFDIAAPEQPNTKRTTTIVPQQALFLLNSPMIATIVHNIVKRPEIVQAVAVERDTNKGIAAIFRILFQRLPTPAEREMAVNFLVRENKLQAEVVKQTQSMREKAAAEADSKNKSRQRNIDFNIKQALVNDGELVERTAFSPWETLVQTLLLSNEAVYVE
jgi:hypothetical protein